MNKVSPGSLIFGGFLILWGISILIDNVFNFNGANRVFDIVFPLLFIASGILTFIKNPKSLVMSGVLIFIGSLFFINNFVSFNIWNLWPLIIIFVGLKILFGDNNSGSSRETQEGVDSIDENIVFWGVDKKIHSNNFSGGDINVMFGGADIDLSEVEMTKDGAKLNIQTIFGGADIKVPKDCKVVIDTTNFLGGVDNRARNPKDATQTLYISGSVMFGGIDIKN